MIGRKHPLFMHISYTISYTILYVRRTISYVKILFLPVVRATLYTMSYTTSYVFWTTSYVQRTISRTFDIVRFLPVLASRTYDIVYYIICFLTMSHTMCKATLVLYEIERKVPMSLAHIAKNILYGAMTSYPIS